jgi:hypothetical protein
MVIDYREAFDEWLTLDPLNNPSATPGPAYMPGYKNPNLEEAEQLNTEAEELFTEGTEAGESGGDWVGPVEGASSARVRRRVLVVGGGLAADLAALRDVRQVVLRGVPVSARSGQV